MVLTETEEAMIVAFRRHTLLPLDDCLHALHSSGSAADALGIASVPAKARYFPPTRCPRGQAEAPAV